MINRWDKFTKYTDYGRVGIVSNLITNAIRLLALGQKNISSPVIMMQPSI